MLFFNFVHPPFWLDHPKVRTEIRGMLELEDALGRILAQVEPSPKEIVPLSEARGRYCAEPVLAAEDLPAFDNSAMDGYAVLAGDTASASPDRPTALQVIGKVTAGETFSSILKPGTCVRIFTGSALPPGADAVVMQEDCRASTAPDKVEVLDSVKPWENVRFRGEDVRKGGHLLKAGQRITVAISGLLAASGCVNIVVSKKPTVGFLATGNELVEAGQPLRSGQIYESNRLALAGVAETIGCRAKLYPIISDTLPETIAAVEKAFAECDVVVTSGGVSVGEFDFVKQAFEAIGGELSFWKVAIKPGKPFVCGRYKNKFLFGLPGNPVSALVTFFLLVRPVLLQMQRAGRLAPLTHPGTLEQTITNKADRRHFMRVSVDEKGRVIPVGVQASHILSGLAEADGLIDVPPRTEMLAGTPVNVLRWDQ